MWDSKWYLSLAPRDPARIDEILPLIEEVWKANPDLRLGQLICNLTPIGKDPFMLEDDVLKALLLAEKEKTLPRE